MCIANNKNMYTKYSVRLFFTSFFIMFLTMYLIHYVGIILFIYLYIHVLLICWFYISNYKIFCKMYQKAKQRQRKWTHP